jgi:hypothetical protein
MLQDSMLQDYETDNTITDIFISFIYVNKSNEIEDISRETYKLNKINFISKEDLTTILKKYISKNSKKIKSYTITSILQYNINIFSQEHVNEYLSKKYEITDLNEIPFLKIIKEISDIDWNPSLPIFKELNELFIIFYENIEIKFFNKKTKKIYLKNIKNNSRKIIS